MLTPEEQKIKEKMHEFIGGLMQKGMQTINKLEPDTTVICSEVESSNYEFNNKFWDLEGNKSYPRDVNCSECQKQVVMSNWMYKEYLINKDNGKPNKIICNKCLPEILKTIG